MALISFVWLLGSTVLCEVKMTIEVPDALHWLFFLEDWKSHKVFSNLILIQIICPPPQTINLVEGGWLHRLIKLKLCAWDWEVGPAPPNKGSVNRRGGVLQRMLGGWGLCLAGRETSPESWNHRFPLKVELFFSKDLFNILMSTNKYPRKMLYQFVIPPTTMYVFFFILTHVNTECYQLH